MASYTIDQAKARVLDALVAAWATSAPTVPLALENESGWSAPAPTSPPAAPATWARAVVRHLDSRQETIAPVGIRRWQNTAQLVVQVFQQAGSGTSAADTLAQIVIAQMMGADLGDLHVYRATPQEIGTRDGWYQINVVATYRYQYIG